MPGHIKLGKPGEPDPDPTPYLVSRKIILDFIGAG
jgi:hypothetical protein